MREKQPAIYILSNKKHGVLYIGVTSNLPNRMYQHQTHAVDGFSKKYNLNNLVYFEMHGEMRDAISPEKQLTHWNREWKIKLIEKENPEWSDLSKSIFFDKTYFVIPRCFIGKGSELNDSSVS